MTLQLVFDGALAAAELLALLFAAPATAREPIPIEQPVQLHRLTSSLDDFPLAGRARLSEDERIADAFRPAPGAQTVAATMAARPPRRDGWNCRATLPVQVDQRPAVPARGAE